MRSELISKMDILCMLKNLFIIIQNQDWIKANTSYVVLNKKNNMKSNFALSRARAINNEDCNSLRCLKKYSVNVNIMIMHSDINFCSFQSTPILKKTS
jgi:hypothetical protein